MRIGVVGSGMIGGNLGKLLARAGHEVDFSFSRDHRRLAAIAEEAGEGARAVSPREAAGADVVVLSVPWDVIDEALAQTGPVEGRIVIDTTNPFGRRGFTPPRHATTARHNQQRIPGARLVKAFNTLTAGFQEASAGREGEDRVVIFFATDDDATAKVAAGLIDDAGFAPAWLGGLDDAELMEAPRRPGAVYGEEYHPAQAAVVTSLWHALRGIRPHAHAGVDAGYGAHHPR